MHLIDSCSGAWDEAISLCVQKLHILNHIKFSVYRVFFSLVHGAGACVYAGDEAAAVYSRGEQCSGGYQLSDGPKPAKVTIVKKLILIFVGQS